jgi:hypothetical protein
MVECSDELKSKAMKQLNALKSTLSSEGVDLKEFIEEYAEGEGESDEGMEMAKSEPEMEDSEDEGEAPKSNPKKAALIIAMLKKKQGSA